MKFLKKEQEKEYAVIGLGRFGGSVARRLEKLGHTVLGIDIVPGAVKEISDEISEAVVMDATDEDALREVDITSFQTVVIAVGDNFESNALIATSLKKMGIPHVIAQSNTDRHREILSRIGVDRVILPEEESGTQLADELGTPGMLETLHLSEDYSLIEIRIPPVLIGKPVDACDPYEVVVVLILRGNELIINPDESTCFLAEDILVLVGEKRRLAEVSNLP